MGRQRIGIIAVGLIALLVGGWFARASVVDGADAVRRTIVEWSTRLRSLAAAEPSAEVALRTKEGESASALIVLGTTGDDAAFAILAVEPDGLPILVVLPQDLLVSVPGFGEQRLVDALVFGGPELAELAIANEFGIRIDSMGSIPFGSITDGLPGPVDVDLSVPLFSSDAAGAVTRVLPAGASRVTADFVETLLTTRGVGDEFDWIQRQGSAWRSVLDAIAAAPGIADRISSFSSTDAFADLLVTVAGEPQRILATIPVSQAQSSSGSDALVATPGQADDFLRERLTHLLLRPEGRPRIEILNGNGRVGTTADIAGTLVRAGFRVVRTDNAETFDFEDTLVVAQGDHAVGVAREAIDLLGRGLLFLEVRAPSGVVDLSIIVGHDIPSGEG